MVSPVDRREFLRRLGLAVAGLPTAGSVLAALLPLCAAGAVAIGSVSLPLTGVGSSLAAALGLGNSTLDPVGETILWTVRLPRVLLAALVGGGLAVVGACL